MRQLVGEIHVTQIGTAKIECENEAGAAVRIDLLDTLLVLDLNVNIFSLRKMRQANIRLEYPVGLGTILMIKSSGESICKLDESSQSRPTLNCWTFLHDPVDFPLLSFAVNSRPRAPVVVVPAPSAAAANAAVETTAAAPGPVQEEATPATTADFQPDLDVGHEWWRSNEEM